MADNTTLPGTGDTIAAEDIAGVRYQRVKLIDATATSTAAIGVAANPLKISGAVTGDFYPATQPVSGTFWQATQPVSGPLTDAQLRASAIPVYGPDVVVSGTITATDAVGGVPGGAGAFINAASTAGSIVSVACTGGDSAWNVQITGMTTGAIYFEGSLDSTNGTNGNWINVNGRRTGVVNTELSGSATANGSYRGNTSGMVYFRVRQTGTYTATPAVVIRISDGVGAIFLNASIPGGTNSIGAVTATLGAETTKVIGTVNVAASQTIAVTQATAANLNATAAQGAAAATASGWPVKVTDGTNVSAVKAASTAAVAADPSLVVAMHPTSPVPLPTLTKGTQGATGITTQDLKDAGRVNIAITCYQAAGIVTTEALFAAATFSRSADGATATTGVQFTVTAGKRFRIQSVECSIKNTAAAAGTSKLVLRYLGAGGTITNTSPILAIWDLGSNNVTANNYIGPVMLPLPDGVELVASGTFGFTSLCSAVTMLHTITLTGYEY